jgi:hypothetical protein
MTWGKIVVVIVCISVTFCLGRETTNQMATPGPAALSKKMPPTNDDREIVSGRALRHSVNGKESVLSVFFDPSVMAVISAPLRSCRIQSLYDLRVH